MPVSSDFSDLLRCLNAEGVRYLVVGVFAVMFHTEPRFTKDLDVWVDPTRANAERVWRALARFGAPLEDVAPADFAAPGNFYIMGIAPQRIDVLTAVDGVEFGAAWRRRARGSYGGVETAFLAAEDLIRNKRRVGRPQDLVDAEKLERWGAAAEPRPSRRRAPRPPRGRKPSP